MSQEEFIKELNKMAGEIMGESARFRHWKDKKQNMYFYTTEKTTHKGKAKYVAGIYRFSKTRQQWRLSKRVGFARKKLAIAWAYEKYQQAKNKAINHTPSQNNATLTAPEASSTEAGADHGQM